MIQSDAVIFGLFAATLGIIFWSTQSSAPFWRQFYKYVPALVLCYFIPALYNTFGLIDAEHSKIYSFCTRYLLPATLVLLTHLAWPLPRGLWGTYVAMSFATFIVYALDKRAARLGQWRVKESTLHGLALLCGWPGALLAQHLLRHKSAKPGFRRVFWLSVALNILAFVCLFTPLLSPFFSGISDHWNTRSAGDFV